MRDRHCKEICSCPENRDGPEDGKQYSVIAIAAGIGKEACVQIQKTHELHDDRVRDFEVNMSEKQVVQQQLRQIQIQLCLQMRVAEEPPGVA